MGLQFLAAQDFLRALDARAREVRLTSALNEALQRLAMDPSHPGLNTEKLFSTRGVDVWSFRIDGQFRAIFAWLVDGRIVLLHFDNHDEAYDWARNARDRIRRIVDRAQAWTGLPQRSAPPLPRLDEDVPVPIESIEALQEMLSEGMYKYLTCLDDFQRNYATVDFSQRSGLMFIRGGAGTGKTAIAVHRAMYLAQQAEIGRRGILYLCFNQVLPRTVEAIARDLGGTNVVHNIEFLTFHSWCRGYLRSIGKEVNPEEDTTLLAADTRRVIQARGLKEALGDLQVKDVVEEIRSIIKPSGVDSLDAYLALERRAATRRLRAAQRAAIWQVYQELHYRNGGRVYWEDMPAMALEALQSDPSFQPYRAVIIDEGQDCTVAMARLAIALVGGDHRRLTVLADPAQCIYPNTYRWARQQFAPRGAQNIVLRVPYRSTKQVYTCATSLFDGAQEADRELLALNDPPRQGPIPEVRVEPDRGTAEHALLELVRAETCGPESGRRLREVAVLTTTNRERDSVISLLHAAGVPVSPLSRERVSLNDETIKVGTIHSAKGLDFPSVYVFRFQASWVEDEERRSLLYVGLTRSSFRLTVICDRESLDPLLKDLRRETYRLTGSARGLLDI